jgi:hypothetical protein
MKIVDANRGLCTHHLDAERRIKDAYSLWRAAYGSITTQDFLKRLTEIPETGDRARETAIFLTRNPERWK